MLDFVRPLNVDCMGQGFGIRNYIKISPVNLFKYYIQRHLTWAGDLIIYIYAKVLSPWRLMIICTQSFSPLAILYMIKFGRLIKQGNRSFD